MSDKLILSEFLVQRSAISINKKLIYNLVKSAISESHALAVLYPQRVLFANCSFLLLHCYGTQQLVILVYCQHLGDINHTGVIYVAAFRFTDGAVFCLSLLTIMVISLFHIYKRFQNLSRLPCKKKTQMAIMSRQSFIA